MTIKQVMQNQMHTNIMFATGRFQIIPGTLIDAVKWLKLDVNSLYDEAAQDQIFEEYIIKVKRPIWKAMVVLKMQYMTGLKSLHLLEFARGILLVKGGLHR
ncbi:hypothetical protein QBX66_23485 [Salmonella enterica subsp. diarizonae serovar 48:i:z]|nr:hypothetical protein QBX66_23485 [Salmonella enterica subsp. diarizonae serovar 48:i:z]